MVSLRQSKDTRQSEKEIFQKVKKPIDKIKKIGYTLDKVLNKYQSKKGVINYDKLRKTGNEMENKSNQTKRNER